MRPSLTDVLARAEDMAVFVQWVPMDRTQRGAYFLPTRTVYLREDMTDVVAVPTLLHELEHASRGDDGHQERVVEARIDRTVACRLITPQEYAEAEGVVGCSSTAIAAELGLPRWVVRAFRQTLRPQT